MSDEPTNKEEGKINLTVRDGMIVAEMRDGVFVSVRWSSAKEAQFMVSQGEKLLTLDVGNLTKSPFRDRIVEAARERLGKESPPNLAEDLEQLAALLRAPTSGGKTLYDELEEVAGRSATVKIVAYARKNAKFFRNAEMDAFAAVSIGDHVENYKLRSKTFRIWLRQVFHETEKRIAEELKATAEGALQEVAADTTPDVPREQSFTDALAQLEALGLFEGPEHEVHLRVAGHDEKIYLDLCSADWKVVEISAAEGWRVIEGYEAPVKFIRKKGALALPEPVRGGSLEPLRELMHIGEGDDGERNWRLITAWLVHSLTPFGPYTVLTLFGNQGSGKTTTQRSLKHLIDPSTAPLRRKPKEDRDLYIAATNGWVISLNNMSGIRDWLSEALCTIAEGGGLSVRKLYHDDEEILLHAMRPIALNGIGDVLTKGDLLDRAIIVRIPDFAQGSSGTQDEEDEEEAREEDKVLNARLEAERPGLLGALLDAVVVYLKNAQDVDRRKIANDIRMVDFAVCGIATERALGGAEGSFLKAYRESRAEGRDTALETLPIGLPLWDFAKTYSEQKPWEGTATELLVELNDLAEDADIRHGKDWPSQPNLLTGQLNRLAPDLAGVGVHVKTGLRGSSGRRLVRLYYSKPKKA
jgi:hypothetical protein